MGHSPMALKTMEIFRFSYLAKSDDRRHFNITARFSITYILPQTDDYISGTVMAHRHDIGHEVFPEKNTHILYIHLSSSKSQLFRYYCLGSQFHVIQIFRNTKLLREPCLKNFWVENWNSNFEKKICSLGQLREISFSPTPGSRICCPSTLETFAH